MSLQWLPTGVTFHPTPLTSMPSSFGGHGTPATRDLAGTQTLRKEINISRILRAIENPPAPDMTNQLNEGRHHRPAVPAAQQEEYFNQLLYPDSGEGSPLMPQPRPQQVTLDNPPQQAIYHRPHYQLGRPNKNLKPIHVSISQQTVNGLLSLLLLSVISIYGCMGTIFIMSALTVVESLQTRGNCYLVSLALAHLLVTLLVIPSSALQIMAGDTLNGQLVCHYQWLTLEFSLIVSQLSFMLIAADNYLGYNCSEKVVTQVASFVQGQQAGADAATTSPMPTNCERHHLGVESTGERGESARSGSGLSPMAARSVSKYQTTAQSMQADFLAQTAQVTARLGKSRGPQHASGEAGPRKQSTLISRLLSNLPRQLGGPKTPARNHHLDQAQPQAQASKCRIRRESCHLKSSPADAAKHSGQDARTPNEWQDTSSQPSGKSRRLAHQFASETGSRLERPGGCVNYRNCCGRIKVLFWIACVWASALAYVLYQHELSFGARFCSTSGSNSYQWGSTSQPNTLNANQPPLFLKPEPDKLSALSSSPVSVSPRLPLPSPLPLSSLGDGPARAGSSPDYPPEPPTSGQVTLEPSQDVAALNERPGREQGTAFHQLVAHNGRESGEADEPSRAKQATLFGTFEASLASTESLTLSGNQSALAESGRAMPLARQSNLLEWTAPTEASDAASRVDRAEVARGHSSEVAAAVAAAAAGAAGANRNEHNPVGTENHWRVIESDQRLVAPANGRVELFLRNRNGATTPPVIPGERARPGQVQVSRSSRDRDRDLDRDYAPQSLRPNLESDGVAHKAPTKREAGPADFIIRVRSIESRNHFGATVAGPGRRDQWPPPISSGAKDDELPSVALKFDAREPSVTNSSADGERAILHTARVVRPNYTKLAHSARTIDAHQPTWGNERLDTKPALAAAAVHLDDDERDDDKTLALTRWVARIKQDEQLQHQPQLWLIDGSQRAAASGPDDGDEPVAAPRWRAERQQLERVSDLNVVRPREQQQQQLLVWLPASGAPQSESRQSQLGDADEGPQGHEQPQTNNINRGRDFPRFPPHNDDHGLSSSPVSRIGPDAFGGGAQKIDEQSKSTEVDGAALASSSSSSSSSVSARLTDSAAPRTVAHIIMHAFGGNELGRAPVSFAKLIATAHGASHSKKRAGRGETRDDNRELAARTTTLNDKPQLDELVGTNIEIVGESSWPGASAGLRSSGGRLASALGSCNSCHRNTQQLETSRGRSSSSSKQIAIAQSQSRDKFSDGQNNFAGNADGARRATGYGIQRERETPEARATAQERACDNLIACDEHTIDRDKQQTPSSLSLALAPGERGPPPARPAASALGPDKREERRGRALMNNNNNKLEMHSNGRESGSRLNWTNAPTRGEQRMQITDKLALSGVANLRPARQVQTPARAGATDRQLDLIPIDFGARLVDEDNTAAAMRFPPGHGLTLASNSTAKQHERRRDYFWHMILCAVVAPSFLAALLFARAYIQMKEFKMRPYKPMPAAALNSTPPALLTPRSPIPLIAQRQVYAFDLPHGVGSGGDPGAKLARQGRVGGTKILSNVPTCVGSSPAGFGPTAGVAHEGEARSVGGDDSRSCGSLAQTEDGENTEEDAGESLARAAHETVRRVSEITGEKSVERRPPARHAHSVNTETCQPVALVRPPAASAAALRQATNTARRQVNQVMSAPPPQTTVGNCRYSPPERHQHDLHHYPWHSFNEVPPLVSCQPAPAQHRLNEGSPSQWLRRSRPFPQDLVPDGLGWEAASIDHRAPGSANSYSPPHSACFQQLANYCPKIPNDVHSLQHSSEPRQQLPNSPRYRHQRHSSPVACSLNPEVSSIMETPQSIIVGSDLTGPYYQQHQQQHQQNQQNSLNRHQNHAQSFHYGTAPHHYQSHAGRQAGAQQRASLQARGGHNRLALINSSRSSGEGADSTASDRQVAPAPDHRGAAMSQALANVIRSVDDDGEPTITNYYDKQQQLSPATAVGLNSAEPSASSATSSLKRRLAPKPLELLALSKSGPQNQNANQNTTNTKVILCTYSYMTDDQLLKSNMFVFLVHSAFWLPFVALCISAQYRDSFTGELRDLVWWLAVLNCCSCSYLYALINKDFREAFHKLFFYCFCQSHVTLQRKTPIFRRQLDVDRKGNLRVHIIPGLNVYSSKLFAASGGLRDGLGNDLSAFAATAHSSTQHAASRPPEAGAAMAVAVAVPGLDSNGLVRPAFVSIAQGH